MEEYGARGAVFEKERGCSRSGVSYNVGVGRYLWWHRDSVPGDENTRFRGGFAIYDGPDPWGLWTTVYYTDLRDVGLDDQVLYPTKWIGEDGRVCHLIFSGDDTFVVRRVTFEVG